MVVAVRRRSVLVRSVVDVTILVHSSQPHKVRLLLYLPHVLRKGLPEQQDKPEVVHDKLANQAQQEPVYNLLLSRAAIPFIQYSNNSNVTTF